MLKDVDAVLFDLDGTLIDSIGFYYSIVELALEKLELPPVERITILEASRNPQFDWSRVLPADENGSIKSVLANVRIVIDNIYPELFREMAGVIPDIDPHLRKLSEDGVKLGIVTSTNRAYIVEKMQVLERADLAVLFEIVVTGDDVSNKKPAPDSLLLAVEKLHVMPERCIYVGDTQADIDAGKAAGMGTIAVLTGFENKQTLELSTPDAIITSLAELGCLYE